MKKSNRRILQVSIVSLILGIFILMYFATPSSTTINDFDSSLGLIQQKGSVCNNWVCKLFHPTQEAYFLIGGSQASTYYVGDTVQVREVLNLGPGVINLFQVIYKDGSSYKILPFMIDNSVASTSDTYLSKDTTFTPSVTGTYTIRTFINRAGQATKELTCEQSGGASSQCSLVVKARSEIPTCSKSSYVGDWSIASWTNGVIKTRKFFGVTSSCEYVSQRDEVIIQCNSGYVCDGTNRVCSFADNLVCVQLFVEPPLTVCPEGTTGTYPDCVDIVQLPEETCETDATLCDIDDGDNVITQGFNLINNKCVYTSTNAKYTTKALCEKDITSGDGTSGDTDDTDGVVDTKAKLPIWILIAIWSSIILLIGGIGFIIYLKKR